VSLPVKKFWKSVNIWGSYGQEFGVLFFETQCSSSCSNSTWTEVMDTCFSMGAFKARKLEFAISSVNSSIGIHVFNTPVHFACYERGFTLQWWHFNVSLFVILFTMYVCVVYVFTCNVLLHLMRKEVYSDRLAGCHCQWRYREIGRRIIMNDAVDSTGWQRCLSDYPLQFAGVIPLAKPAKSLYVVAERVITCS